MSPPSPSLPLAALTLAAALGSITPATAQPLDQKTNPTPAPSFAVSQTADGALQIDNASVDDALRLAQNWIENNQPELAEQLLSQLAPCGAGTPEIPTKTR
jgi:hypothetical protein